VRHRSQDDLNVRAGRFQISYNLKRLIGGNASCNAEQNFFSRKRQNFLWGREEAPILPEAPTPLPGPLIRVQKIPIKVGSSAKDYGAPLL